VVYNGEEDEWILAEVTEVERRRQEVERKSNLLYLCYQGQYVNGHSSLLPKWWRKQVLEKFVFDSNFMTDRPRIHCIAHCRCWWSQSYLCSSCHCTAW
jgi:hypothetical protein